MTRSNVSAARGVPRLALLAALLLWLAAPLAQARPATVAVWDFDNASFMDPAASDYLGRALPEMLISRLAGGAVTVVERVQLRAALEEQKLGSSTLADEDGRIRLGRILGARYMVFGGFMLLDDQLRVDARVVEVETSLTRFAGSAEGLLDDAVPIMGELADKIAAAVGAGEGGGRPGGGLEVWQEYEQGLAHIDQGDYEAALTVFQAVLEKHPDFQPAERQIGLVLEQMARQ